MSFRHTIFNTQPKHQPNLPNLRSIVTSKYLYPDSSIKAVIFITYKAKTEFSVPA
jgi:hypothetical protein